MNIVKEDILKNQKIEVNVLIIVIKQLVQVILYDEFN